MLAWRPCPRALFQGVVTYASPVEAFVIGIKMESNFPTFFFGANQGIKMNSEQLISTDQHIFLDSTEAWLRFVL